MNFYLDDQDTYDAVMQPFLDSVHKVPGMFKARVKILSSDTIQ